MTRDVLVMGGGATCGRVPGEALPTIESGGGRGPAQAPSDRRRILYELGFIIRLLFTAHPSWQLNRASTDSVHH
jgi:hypothetical protein